MWLRKLRSAQTPAANRLLPRRSRRSRKETISAQRSGHFEDAGNRGFGCVFSQPVRFCSGNNARHNVASRECASAGIKQGGHEPPLGGENSAAPPVPGQTGKTG